jgi:hypothetical protein
MKFILDVIWLLALTGILLQVNAVQSRGLGYQSSLQDQTHSVTDEDKVYKGSEVDTRAVFKNMKQVLRLGESAYKECASGSETFLRVVYTNPGR